MNATNLVVLSAGSGEVTLTGSVDTKAQAARAVQVARNIAGVKRIEDKLVRESEAHVPATPHQSTTIDAHFRSTQGKQKLNSLEALRMWIFQHPTSVYFFEGDEQCISNLPRRLNSYDFNRCDGQHARGPAEPVDLSQRRAQAIQGFLLSNGIGGERIAARGYGEIAPGFLNYLVAIYFDRHRYSRPDAQVTRAQQQ